jgi:hypothetical protein
MKRVEGEAPSEPADLALSEEVFSEQRAEAEGAGEDEGGAAGGARGRHGAAALRSSTAAYRVS